MSRSRRGSLRGSKKPCSSAEEAFASEFAKLIAHLGERLSGSDDGKPKVFRDSAVGNLREFFDRFRDLSIHSNQQLDDLIQQAQKLLKGVGPQDLRESGDLRRPDWFRAEPGAVELG